MMKKDQDVILTIGAHNDDYILGAGGTVAKAIDEGARVINIIFSYGEMSHPWQDKDVTRDMRLAESLNADKVLGGKDIIYLGIPEGRFPQDFPDRRSFVMKVLGKYRPKRIFTHSGDDPHPDHRAVHRIVMDLHKELAWQPEVYTFDVWNVLSILNRNRPKLVMDITPYLHKKVDSFKQHQSQRIVIILHLWSVYLKAFLNGLSYGYRYAEVFRKER